MSGEVHIAFVVAVAENGVIGRDGKLPWRLPSDLKWFRKVTLGKPVIMGRKTYDSIGKPLEGRDNIVVTRQRNFAAAGVCVATSIEEAIDLGRQLADKRGVDEVVITAKMDEVLLPLPEGRSYLGFIFASGDDPARVEQSLRGAHATLAFDIEREIELVPR